MYMRSGRRFSRGVSRVARPKYEWSTNRITSTALAAGATQDLNLLNGLETQLGILSWADVTIMRIRGELLWTPDAAANSEFAFGMLVEPAPLTAALSSPSANPYLGWMYLTSQFYITNLSTVVNDLRIPIDIKARRTIREAGDVLRLKVENPSAQALHYAGFLRVLVRTGRK